MLPLTMTILGRVGPSGVHRKNVKANPWFGIPNLHHHAFTGLYSWDLKGLPCVQSEREETTSINSQMCDLSNSLELVS